MKKYLLFAIVAIAMIFGSCKSTKQEEQTENSGDQQTQEVVQTDEGNESTETNESSESTESTESIEQKNAKLLAGAESSREKAVASGADSYYADQLKSADEQLASLKEQAKDSKKDMSKEINDVKYRYMALERASATRKLKEKIEENGFNEEHKIAYDAAEVLYAELEKVISENADGKTMYNSADAAYAAYYTIFYNSFKKLADKERAASLEQKKNADNVKAGVAQKDQYKAIVEVFKKADSAYVTKNPEKAYDLYKESKEKFEALYKDVAEKRAAAQKRIDEAKAKVLDIENFAKEADTVAPIGEEKIDGIEEQDTVLLEEETFTNPEESVIEIEDSIEATNDTPVEVLKSALEGEDK